MRGSIPAPSSNSRNAMKSRRRHGAKSGVGQLMSDEFTPSQQFKAPSPNGKAMVLHTIMREFDSLRGYQLKKHSQVANCLCLTMKNELDHLVERYRSSRSETRVRSPTSIALVLLQQCKETFNIDFIISDSSNGRTKDSDSFNCGSNP